MGFEYHKAQTLNLIYSHEYYSLDLGLPGWLRMSHIKDRTVEILQLSGSSLITVIYQAYAI